jgi:outer membrane receptor for ferrienterochelin and colicins
MKSWLFFFICLTILPDIVFAQSDIKLVIKDATSGQVLQHVSVTPKGTSAGKLSDSTGFVSFSGLQPGNNTFTFSSSGYKTQTVIFIVPDSSLHEINMEPDVKSMEEVTIVSSTRNNQRIENSPLKVEVLGREEMEEENTIKPANIASILGDVSGIQIQQSSAVSGNSNVRIQGLGGQYTQILRDGLPLFEGFSGGFGVLSIPPLDLRQVELIKGSASTLYGGGAIGGLINIISRRPGSRQEAVFTANQTTLKETNLNTYLSKKYKHIGYTFFSGYTKQKAVDVDKDGFSDVPELEMFVIHPRLFVYPGDHTTITVGYTGSFENRKGGDLLVINNKADAVHQYFEKNILQRHSAELMLESNIGKESKLHVKGSISSFNRSINTNTHYFNGNQLNYFSEASILIPDKHYSFVSGINLLGDRFKILPSDPVLLTNTSNYTLGFFAQNTWRIKEKTVLEAGLRNDYQNNYGNFFLPRLSVFHRFNEVWASRAGIGWGYKIPNALSPQLFDYNIEQINPLPANIKAEKSTGYNIELNYKKTWGNENEFFINHAFFLTEVRSPLIATEDVNQLISFSSGSEPILTKGFDTYIQAVLSGWELYAGYTFTIAERKYLSQNQFMPLTPKNRMAFTLVKIFEEIWRLGLEGSYNGFQYREDGSKTPGYLFMAAMVERKFGSHFSIVLNGENLLDYRQSKQESLYTGSITNPAFKPLWAPIDGRVINLSVRIKA